jgi:hypothetical protein
LKAKAKSASRKEAVRWEWKTSPADPVRPDLRGFRAETERMARPSSSQDSKEFREKAGLQVRPFPEAMERMAKPAPQSRDLKGPKGLRDKMLRSSLGRKERTGKMERASPVLKVRPALQD